jgi:hypothetical protein
MKFIAAGNQGGTCINPSYPTFTEKFWHMANLAYLESFSRKMGKDLKRLCNTSIT